MKQRALIGGGGIASMSSVGFGLSPASGRALMQPATVGACDFAGLSHLRLDRFAGLAADWQDTAGWVLWSLNGEKAA